MSKPLIVGAGAALVDLLIEESDAFVARLGAEKGGMTLVEKKAIEDAIDSTVSLVRQVPGGSACNTLVGIANLGGRARMVGRLGPDELAKTFHRGLEMAGVEAYLVESTTPTGRVLSVVTPDTQRTMFTYLGASSELRPEDIGTVQFEGAALMVLEGYLLFNRPVVEKLLAIAKLTGARVVLDLASFEVVRATKDYLEKIIPESVDILIANEDEARAYTGLGEEESLERFAPMVDIAVVKRGKDGVLVARGQARHRVEACIVPAVDTTGAGDLWAAGFLYGLTEGLPLEKAAALGCKVGAEVVQVMGAVIPKAGWERIEIYKADVFGV